MLLLLRVVGGVRVERDVMITAVLSCGDIETPVESKLETLIILHTAA